MSKDELGDRMKFYEGRYTDHVLLPMIPVLARMDGRAFHTFTKGLERPYDKRLSDLMIATTVFLVQETNARCGYCQSDEITLVWLAEDPDSEIFFGGKLLKMVSVVGALTTAYFNKRLPEFLPEKSDQMPVFDTRIWNVPTEWEAANCFIWREMDATRNSVSMAAQAYYSHNELMGKSTADKHDMLHAKGINWNDYPSFFKRGTYVRRREVKTQFSPEELASLPPKHAARTNPNLEIRRTVVMQEDFPPLTRLANRTDVILHGAVPEICSEKEMAL
jgi:tRNA(His) 5'-end guanylyltransferase